MAFQEVTGLDPELQAKRDAEKYAFMTKGDTLVGYFLGTETFKSKDGDTLIKHKIQTDAEGLKSPLGSSDLNRKLQKVEPGTYVQIIFQGKKKLSGGKTLKVFTVNQDPDKFIEVSAQTARYEEVIDLNEKTLKE